MTDRVTHDESVRLVRMSSDNRDRHLYIRAIQLSIYLTDSIVVIRGVYFVFNNVADSINQFTFYL